MQNLETLTLKHGFDLFKVTPAALNPPAFDHYHSWVTQGRAAEMVYMVREPKRRRSVIEILPGIQCVIALGVNYYRPKRETMPPPLRSGATGQVARYAYGRDYHKILTKNLKLLVRELSAQYPGHIWRPYVDTGAILERAYAAQAGLGYVGKNTLLITREFGSWVFLAEILTTAELSLSDLPHETDSCGHCRLCLDICPTGALVAPYELDARKCISYWTIEHRGSIPEVMRPLIGDWLYGCDLCQEVCPKNVRAQATPHETLTATRLGGDHQFLRDILTLQTDEEFLERFAGSPMVRAKREGLVRNACVVAANVKAVELLSILEKLTHEDASEVVREHAAWAVAQLKNYSSSPSSSAETSSADGVHPLMAS